MAIAIIPARFASTRLPGKVLVVLAGKTMIQRVWERASSASKISRVIIATDDERIVQAATAFGAEAVMTRAEHRTGTERIAEVAATSASGGEQIYLNVQGDDPLVEPAAIDTLVEALESDESVSVATLMVPIAKPADIMDPNVVKVVLDFDGNALYFSRAPIPWVRVFRLKDFVFFDHRYHLMNGAQCEECHGPIGTEDVVSDRLKTTSMSFCQPCHVKTRALTGCTTCHDPQ